MEVTKFGHAAAAAALEDTSASVYAGFFRAGPVASGALGSAAFGVALSGWPAAGRAVAGRVAAETAEQSVPMTEVEAPLEHEISGGHYQTGRYCWTTGQDQRH